MLNRVLNYKVSIAALLEISLWLAVPYLAIGLTWSAFNPAYAEHIHDRLENLVPAGADLVAFVDAALLWPVLIFGSYICPT